MMQHLALVCSQLGRLQRPQLRLRHDTPGATTFTASTASALCGHRTRTRKGACLDQCNIQSSLRKRACSGEVLPDLGRSGRRRTKDDTPHTQAASCISISSSSWRSVCRQCARSWSVYKSFAYGDCLDCVYSFRRRGTGLAQQVEAALDPILPQV